MRSEAAPTAQLVANDLTVRRSNQFARALDAAGIAPDARIALLSGNRAEFVWSYRGATWSGRTIVPISWRWHPRDIDYVLRDSGAQALVVDAAHADLLGDPSIIPERARFCFGGEVPGFRDWQAAVDELSDEQYAAEHAGDAMLYTSGTTGRPKGVVRPPADRPPPPFSAIKGAAMLERTPGALAGPHLVSTPLYHSAPLFYCDGATLLGLDLVIMNRFDPEALLRAIEQHRVASTFLVPTQFVRLLALPDAVRARYDLSSLKLVVHGSAPVSVPVKSRMIEWLGPILYEFYGGSEGGGSTGISSAEWLQRPGSVGKIISGTRLRILDPAGQELAPGTEGEVWFDGGQEFAYHGDAAKTAEARRGSMATLGDIGHVDDDGYLFLADRRSDVIISGGVNVYPAQIESVLQGHEAVADVCVVGLPDDEWGQIVVAVVQLNPSAADPDALREDILGFARAELAGYQVPRELLFSDALPRTETGKLSRRSVREDLLRDGGAR